MDDGALKCLPHPAERGFCEAEGLTLGQASARGRLYRETFYVCRNCGREGETIERAVAEDQVPWTLPVRGAMKWGWGAAAVVVPLLMWMQWWQAVAVIGTSLLALPGIVWWENRKASRRLPARDFPRVDAPGRFPVVEPAAGCCRGTVIGRPLPVRAGVSAATGPCCDKPDWIEGFRVTDEDRVPCRACGRGTMIVSEHAIH